MRCVLQGCLKPVKIIIPKGSLLDPSETAAVVGGNVLTSQRVVDVVLAAFHACAASQGCMNNITLGTENWGYYETVAGGSGAVSTHSRKLNCRYKIFYKGFHLVIVVFFFFFSLAHRVQRGTAEAVYTHI